MRYNKSVYNHALRQVRVYLEESLGGDFIPGNCAVKFAKLKYGLTLTRKEARNWLIEISLKGELRGWPVSPSRAKAIRRRAKSKRKNGLTGAGKYENFLQTIYWKNVRKLVLERDGYACTKCGSEGPLHIHHLTYVNHFNELEHLEDLITLCKECHRNIHKD